MAAELEVFSCGAGIQLLFTAVVIQFQHRLATVVHSMPICEAASFRFAI